MDNLLEIAKILIQTIGAIVVAIITKKIVPKRSSNRAHKARVDYVGWGIVGVTAALTFFGLGFLYNALTPKPTVDITSPRSGEAIEVKLIETGSGSFLVSGRSERVATDPNVRVYVLIHPSDPFAAGWWIQTPVVMDSDGHWYGQAWIGNLEFPPEVGHTLDILAVVAYPDKVQHRVKVDDYKDLNPIAQSDIVAVRIGSIE